MNRGEGHWGRPLALAIALALPGSALALGLGEARVDSFLNQPLDVRMRLLDTSADDLDTLTVAAASPEEYQRLGLASGSLALDLEISIDRSQSPPVVRVRSRRPVSDPVVQLLIDARWSSGRMLREYTLFLDPPTVPVAPPAAPQPAPETDPATGRTAAPRPSTRSEPDAPEPAPRAQARMSADRYGPVAGGETLWSIAQANLRPGVTMDQMMLAIVELNPGAFRDRNVNRLMRGAQLELPDAGQARAIDPETAAAMVAEQNRAFRRGIGADVPVVSDAARSAADRSGADTGSADAETGQADHRLALVPPTDEGEGNGMSGDAAEVEALRQQLARAEEELFAARQEADEFRDRLSELEDLVRGNPNAIGVRDVELAGLEQTLREAREATREDSDPELRSRVSEQLDEYIEQFEAATDAGDAADTAGPAQDADAAPALADAGDADDPAAATDPADAAAPEAEAVSPPERVVTEIGGRGFLQRLLDGTTGWLLAGLGVLLALVALAGLVVRRKRREAAPAVPAQRAEPRAPAAPAAPADPVARARAAVTERPHELARHVELLRTLAGENDQAAFADALEAMFEHVDSGQEPEWREALELAERTVPGHALVKGSSDWVARGDEGHDDEPSSELDREAEVDDLMSRLDADLDEPDDRDWVAGEPDEPAPEPDGPLLREDDAAPAKSSASAAGKPGTEASDDDIDLSEWADEDAGAEDTVPSASADSGGDDDDLVLDWPDDEDEAAGEQASDQRRGRDSTLVLDEDELPGNSDEPTLVLDEDELPGEAEDDEDIFAQGDDDVAVKLDLARAYLSWNSNDSARTLLEEILQEGNEEQRAEARRLLDEIANDSGN